MRVGAYDADGSLIWESGEVGSGDLMLETPVDVPAGGQVVLALPVDPEACVSAVRRAGFTHG
jgi:hypothetical protein